MQRTLAKLERGEPVVIVALGDSNTEITFHTRGHLNWVGLLEAGIFMRYGSGQCRLVNAGKCGSTMMDGLHRLDRDVLRFSPDLVIMALGLNDAGRGEAGLEVFALQARQLIQQISAAQCEVLVRTFNPVVSCNGLPMPTGVTAGGVIDRNGDARYAATLVRIASELGSAVVDHHSLWTQASFKARSAVANPNGLWIRMSDAVHPGPLGHLVFYRELAPLFDLDPVLPWEMMGDQAGVNA